MLTSIVFSLLLGIATAQEVEPLSQIRFAVETDTKVQTLPTVKDQMAEIRLTHCDLDLIDAFSTVKRPEIRRITPINMGESSWLLRIDLARPDVLLRSKVVDGVLEINVYGADQFETQDLQPVLTTEDLFDDLFETSVVLPPSVDLRPLFGSAISYPMSTQDVPFELMSLTGDDNASEWADVTQARNRYLEAQQLGLSGLTERGNATYSLGIAYLNEGLAMEADFYLNKLRHSPGDVPFMDIFLAKSKASLLQKDWDTARQNLRQAYSFGAEETLVVEGMAHISHATGLPSRSNTGRLLASLTSKPEALLLAGELLQMDGRYQEAWEILEPLYTNQMFEDNPEMVQRLRLRLGDISYFLGDNQQAQVYWRGTYPDMRQVRMLQVNMVNEGSNVWVETVPQLRVIAEDGTTQNAAEALYLIGQVYSKYGTQLDAVELWAEFVRTYPELLDKTDVLDMLNIAYQERIRALYKKQYWMRIAKTHELGWVPELRGVIDDPDVLIMVADAYAQLGLPDRALYALISDFGIGTNTQFYLPDAELYLAKLYFQSNRFYEVHRTLELMNTDRLPTRLRPEIQFLEAQTYLAENNLDKAKTLFEQTAQTAEFRTPSYVALGVLARQEGDCDAAVAYLKPTLVPLAERSTDDPLAFLYLSQCLGEKGEYQLASEVAEALQGISSDPEEIQHAQYLQSLFSTPGAVTLDAIEDVDAESIWVELVDEQQKSDAFWTELETWKQSK